MEDLKKTARIGMKGKWLQSAAICLSLWIPGLLTGIFEFLLRLVLKLPAFIDGQPNNTLASVVAALGCSLLCFLLWSPLSIGSIRWYWKEYQGTDPHLRAVLFYFESYPSYLKAAGMWVCVAFRLLWWYLFFCLPAIVMGGLFLWRRFWMGVSPELGIMNTLFWGVVLFWPLLALLLTCIVAQRYLLAPCLLAEKPDDPIRRLLRRSVRLMKGYQVQAFGLRLSFFPWYLPGICAVAVLLVSLVLTGYQTWLLPVSGGLILVQILLGFYLKPWKHAVLARYSGQILYGDNISQDENITREYVSSYGESMHPPVPPALGSPGLP